jgi:hypothetical protein
MKHESIHLSCVGVNLLVCFQSLVVASGSSFELLERSIMKRKTCLQSGLESVWNDRDIWDLGLLLRDAVSLPVSFLGYIAVRCLTSAGSLSTRPACRDHLLLSRH